MKSLRNIFVAGAVFGLAVALLPSQLQAQRSGVEAWSQTCGNCHEIQPPNRYTAGQWEIIVGHMAHAARLSDAEAAAILQFLQSGARQLIAEQEPAQEGVLVASTTTMVPPLRDSAQDYRDNCLACHGPQGKGDGPAAAAFNPKPANFTDTEFMASRTDEQFTESITNGLNAMPGFASQLDAARIEALVRYIRTLAQGN